MSDLVLWDYYIREELRHGPSFDIELASQDNDLEEEALAGDMGGVRLGQHTLTKGEENVTLAFRRFDVLSQTLE